jgi:hypothetical protein
MENQMEYNIDFINEYRISKNGELTLLHMPIEYRYMGSVYAGTGSKNRHRYEKTIITWKRQFLNENEAREYLTSLNLANHFEQDPVFVAPSQKPFGIRRFKLGPGWLNITVYGGELSTEVDYCIEDNT